MLASKTVETNLSVLGLPTGVGLATSSVIVWMESDPINVLFQTNRKVSLPVLPGGKLNCDETPRQAALRELSEEHPGIVQSIELVGFMGVAFVQKEKAETGSKGDFHVESSEADFDLANFPYDERYTVRGIDFIFHAKLAASGASAKLTSKEAIAAQFAPSSTQVGFHHAAVLKLWSRQN